MNIVEPDGVDAQTHAKKEVAKELQKAVPADEIKPPQPGITEKTFTISEKAVNQLLNTIADLPGLTWRQTNPIIVFIQQNLQPNN